MSEERTLGNRFFRALSDAELAAWRPASYRGLNVGAANREMRRRAKIEGLATPYHWIAKHGPGREWCLTFRGRCAHPRDCVMDCLRREEVAPLQEWEGRGE